MKARTGKIYTSILYAILLALFLILFLTFVEKPYSGQKVFFLILVPLVMLVNYAINMIEMSFSHVESILTTFMAATIVQISYTLASIIVAIILALVSVQMKNQIVIQVVIFLVAAAGFAVTLFTATAAKDTRKANASVVEKKIVMMDFKSAVVAMQEHGLTGEALQTLSALAEDFRHIAPCNDPSAKSLDEDISSTLAAMVGDDVSNAEVHLAKLRFLMKRRSILKSQ